MDGIAQAQFIVFQNFPAKCVYCNILGSGQEGEQGGKPQDGPDAFFGVETAKGTNGEQQADLGDQHPTPATAEAGNAETVQQRRPEELPGVGELDQREETDCLQIDTLTAQPGWQEVEQQIERQAGRKAGEDADQHLPAEQG